MSSDVEPEPELEPSGTGCFELEPESEPEKVSVAPDPTLNRPETGSGAWHAGNSRGGRGMRRGGRVRNSHMLEPELLFVAGARAEQF